MAWGTYKVERIYHRNEEEDGIEVFQFWDRESARKKLRRLWLSADRRGANETISLYRNNEVEYTLTTNPMEV